MEANEEQISTLKKRYIDDIERIFNEYPETFDGLKEGVIEKFRDWYPSNMHVIDAFEKEAFYLLTRGRRERYSIYTIREKLRWDSLVSESGQDYKLNNNYSPFIARILMFLNSDMDGMFSTRRELETEELTA